LCQQAGPAAVEGTLKLSTKYYEASTQLSVLGASMAPPTGTEAVLLVISCAQEGCLAAVQLWATQHDTDTAGVRLVVATHADLLPVQEPGSAHATGTGRQSVRPAWLTAALEWCSEHCWEYIEVCCTDPEVDSQLQLDGEPHGISRVTEALHAHMWPGLVRVPPTQALQPRQLVADSTSTAPSLPESQAEGAQGNGNGNGQHYPGDSNGAGAPCSQQPAGVAGVAEAGSGQRSDPERQADQYGKLMDEMAAARGQLGGLEDDARRARAAELAMRFAQMLGMDTDSSDAGEESS